MNMIFSGTELRSGILRKIIKFWKEVVFLKEDLGWEKKRNELEGQISLVMG